MTDLELMLIDSITNAFGYNSTIYLLDKQDPSKKTLLKAAIIQNRDYSWQTPTSNNYVIRLVVSNDTPLSAGNEDGNPDTVLVNNKKYVVSQVEENTNPLSGLTYYYLSEYNV